MERRHARGVKRNGRWRASQKARKRIDEIFGSMKTTGNFRKSCYRGVRAYTPARSTSQPPAT